MFNKKFLKHYYIMLIPAIIWLVLFNIVPMVGIVMAFVQVQADAGNLDPSVGPVGLHAQARNLHQSKIL